MRHFVAALMALAASATAGEVRFKKIVVDRAFRSEGVATADVNRDGRLDILAGDVWYEAPGWKMHEVRPVRRYNPARGYSLCFQNFAQDVNGDGWPDSIVVNFPGKSCTWYENPKGKPGHWKERVVWPSACGETPLFDDLLGTGRPASSMCQRALYLSEHTSMASAGFTTTTPAASRRLRRSILKIISSSEPRPTGLTTMALRSVRSARSGDLCDARGLGRAPTRARRRLKLRKQTSAPSLRNARAKAIEHQALGFLVRMPTFIVIMTSPPLISGWHLG